MRILAGRVIKSLGGTRMLRGSLRAFTKAIFVISIFGFSVFAQNQYEGREISEIALTFENDSKNGSSGEQLRLIARDAMGSRFSAVKVRDAIEALYKTKRVASVLVQASNAASDAVNVKFVVKPISQVARVNIKLPDGPNQTVTEQELRIKLNLIEPGKAVSEQTLRNNSDVILDYLRDNGYFRADVTYEQQPIKDLADVEVTFNVVPGSRATVEKFNIAIKGFDETKLAKEIKLKPGESFTQNAVAADVARIREALRKENFLAPTINEPRVVYDSESNKIEVSLTGETGPTVEVTVVTEKEKIGRSTQTRLLPLKREGTLDYAAIIEGERRLENYYQEQGYFFADVLAVCSVEPALTVGDANAVKNDTAFLCSALNAAELTDRKVEVKYTVNLNRRLKLVDIRLQGTDKFTIDEIATVLDSQRANILGIIPLFGYGRGYTSERILAEDSSTIRSLLQELGYRDADVRVNQGVSLDGESLIITFVVDEGKPTVISEVQIEGNLAFDDATLLSQLPSISGGNFSRAKLRNGQRKLSEYYSQRGFYEAVVDFSIDELPVDATGTEKKFRIVYTIENEGKPFYIDRILVTGVNDTKPEAVLRAVTMNPGDLLKAADIYTSEQNLYSSDAFSRVDVKPEPSGERPDGTRSADVIVDVAEQAPRILSWGGGYSTDLGWSGFADVRHFNLLGRLWQGGARIRWSQRQQLVQMDFVNPRFLRDGDKRFAPLTLSVQYQRDSTVTRFFRSAFDSGTFGIVQRLDANGNPIDEFGANAGSPTLNRFTLSAETNRTISRKDRSIIFFKYRFEDVRLFNVQSLLIRDLLIPDSRIRISGFGATFVRDTRRNCSVKYSILDIIARGEPGEPCRYSASDPTHGDYFTAEYNVSIPFLGANIGFNKFQASYNYYYTFKRLKNTTLAGRAILGLADVFSRDQQFPSTVFPDLEDILPISERFFAGGSNTLRGFDFESAGPRVVVVPQGTFRNSNGEAVFLDPFTIPFGGNALAVVNLEARIPMTKSLRAVPFYDGGNVFRRIGDIANPPDVPPGDVFRQNIRALWSHTIGLGFRLKTPVGGEFGIDYGY
ncbi:MAG: POTRA domain-containing protein [Blastocatellia bacterium]